MKIIYYSQSKRESFTLKETPPDFCLPRHEIMTPTGIVKKVEFNGVLLRIMKESLTELIVTA